MPLSEYEYRMLTQIESALCADDPDFASCLRNDRNRVPRGSITGRIRGAAVFMIGLTALISGLAFKATMVGGFPIVSVLGYLAMWGGAVRVVTAPSILGAMRMAGRVARWAREEPA